MGLDAGLTLAQIGHHLGLCEDTIKHYCKTLYRKLNVRNAHGAVGRGHQLGLLTVEREAAS